MGCSWTKVKVGQENPARWLLLICRYVSYPLLSSTTSTWWHSESSPLRRSFMSLHPITVSRLAEITKYIYISISASLDGFLRCFFHHLSKLWGPIVSYQVWPVPSSQDPLPVDGQGKHLEAIVTNNSSWPCQTTWFKDRDLYISNFHFSGWHSTQPDLRI